MRKPDRMDPENGPHVHAARRAFTLIELLVVLAIIAIVAAITVPAMSSIRSSYNLDTVGQSVAAQLNLARQNAVASSRPVQVRFYKLADYNGSTGTPVYRAMQSFIEGTTSLSGTATVTGGMSVTGTTTVTSVTPISKAYFFPSPVVCLTTAVSGTDLSSLLDYNVTSYSGIQYVSAGDSNNPLTSPYGAAPYIYFRFRSNGQVDQSTTGTTAWTNGTLTLALENAATVAATGLPANYASVQLNAFTGAVRVFRP